MDTLSAAEQAQAVEASNMIRHENLQTLCTAILDMDANMQAIHENPEILPEYDTAAAWQGILDMARGMKQ